MTPDQNEVNGKDKHTTIKRGRHDKEKPYLVVSKALFQDPFLSPRTKGVLGYLLTLPDNWQVHPRQVAKCMGVGHDLIYAALKEMLKNGYATCKKAKVIGGRFSCTSWEFFEEKITVSGKPDTEKPDTENPTLKNTEEQNTHRKSTDRENLTSLKVPAESAGAVPAKAGEIEVAPLSKLPKKKGADFTPEVHELADQMVKSLMRVKPDYKPPTNLVPMLTHIDFMLRLDKRTIEKLMDVFNWALADAFWADKMFKPNPAEYLRKQFDQLEMKMNSKPVKIERHRGFAPCSNDERALKKMDEWSKNAL